MTKKKNILLADNDDDYRDFLKNDLESHGYIIHTASSPYGAKEIYLKQNIDLAIIDIRLRDDDDPHDRSGIEIAAFIHTNIPKIVLSTYLSESSDHRLPKNTFMTSKEIQKVINLTNDLVADKENEAMVFSEESRMFYGPGFKKPLVATLITGISEQQLVNRYLDGFTFFNQSLKESKINPESLIKLLARIAYRGTILPPFVTAIHGEVVAPMTFEDQLKIATRLCELETFPTKEEYTEGSSYLRARSIIEEAIGVSHIHLKIQEKKQEDVEFSADKLAKRLGSFDLAFAGSPELKNLSLSELLSASKSVITALGGPGSAVTAASSVVAITDIHAHNFEAAFSVALSGAAIAVIFRFSDYIGRIFKVAERQLDNRQSPKKLQPKE